VRDANHASRRLLNIAHERQCVHAPGIAMLGKVAQRFLGGNSIATNHHSAAGS